MHSFTHPIITGCVSHPRLSAKHRSALPCMRGEWVGRGPQKNLFQKAKKAARRPPWPFWSIGETETKSLFSQGWSFKAETSFKPDWVTLILHLPLHSFLLVYAFLAIISHGSWESNYWVLNSELEPFTVFLASNISGGGGSGSVVGCVNLPASCCWPHKTFVLTEWLGLSIQSSTFHIREI